jgi:8-hydroxy-5-deazaflavin:NADPH oxidoreductase
MKIAVLGSGVVGETLANGFLAKGHEVVRGSREPSKMDAWKAGAGAKAKVATFADAAKDAEVVVLAVKGTAAATVIEMCGSALDGKVVVDTTNPIAEQAPKDGVIAFFTGPNESLMEKLQEKAPNARFVKAFSCVGNAFMVDPDFGGQRPTMFICGNDEKARAQTKELLSSFGWDTKDMGVATAARAIEPLCILWCIPGMREGKWAHAFKLLEK